VYSPLGWIRVRPDPDGRFTAEAIGMPDVRATADRRDAAVRQVEAVLNGMVGRGELVPAGTTLARLDPIDPDEPMEQEFLRQLELQRREDLDRTLREYEAQCPGSSSTPTT
jgi:hypothetical protein